MCGISAVWKWSGGGVPFAGLRAMARAQAHRGPDGHGYALWREDGAHGAWRGRAGQAPALDGAFRLGLAHNLLAIQDPSPAALQPMERAGGRFWVSFNGEVYNFPELRAELAAGGAAFRTGSDTEVLLAAWEADGPAALRRLRGMFAFALYDAALDTLWLARDRFGIKPLYWAGLAGGEGIAAASELRGIHASGLVARAWDEDAVRAFLAAGVNQPGEERTFFSGVRELPAGCVLRVRPGEAALERWYTPRDPGACTVGEADLPALRDAFRESVRIHLRSSREVGICLSGGLDSSNLAAAAAEALGERAHDLRTFTFGAPGSLDVPLARAAASALGLAHQVEAAPAAHSLADLAETAVACETPNHMWGPVNQFLLLRRIAARGVPVLLDGQGGDEVLSGYPWFVPPVARFVAERFGAAEGAALAAACAARAPFPAEILEVTQRMYNSRAGWITTFDGGAAAALGVSRREVAGWEAVRWYVNDAVDWAGMRHWQLRRRELAHFLRHEDRLGMWFGIETRVPFLDHPLVDAFADADPRFLYRDGLAKYPLRVLFPALPEALRMETRKAGYWENHAALPPGLAQLAARAAAEAGTLGGVAVDPAAVAALAPPAAWRFLQVALLSAGGDAGACRGWLEAMRAPAPALPVLEPVP